MHTNPNHQTAPPSAGLIFDAAVPPGGVIPRPKHLEQDEILPVQTGTAHVTLDDKEYDLHAGGTVFFPAQTWVSLKTSVQTASAWSLSSPLPV